MDKTIVIDGKEVKFRANALIPRIYRYRYGRDIIQDFAILKKSYDKVMKNRENKENTETAQLSVFDLTAFENIAFCMAKMADNEIPDTVEEWLEGFETFSIYQVLPELIKLWKLSNGTTAVPKKK